jgi:hypothetical protein
MLVQPTLVVLRGYLAFFLAFNASDKLKLLSCALHTTFVCALPRPIKVSPLGPSVRVRARALPPTEARMSSGSRIEQIFY